jgi:alpha-1,3-rhamnosyltransferase
MAPACRNRFRRFEFRPRTNRGLCETLNEATGWAQGKYFAVLDSDDILLPHKTSTLVAELEANAGLVGVFGGCHLIDESGARMGHVRPAERLYSFGDILSRQKAFASSSMLVRLDEVRRSGGYKNGLYIEDWYMWLKLTETGGTMKVLSQPLILYRQHGTNMSKRAVKMFQARKEILDMYPGRAEVPLALAGIWLELAVELARTSKGEALRCIASSLRHSLAPTKRLYFWITLLRALSPVFLLDLLSSARKRLRAARS